MLAESAREAGQPVEFAASQIVDTPTVSSLTTRRARKTSDTAQLAPGDRRIILRTGRRHGRGTLTAVAATHRLNAIAALGVGSGGDSRRSKPIAARHEFEHRRAF